MAKRLPAQTVTWFGLITLLLSLGQTARADSYSDSWGPAVGTVLPVLAAPDQTGAVRSLDTLSGEQGLLLFLVRSADW